MKEQIAKIKENAIQEIENAKTLQELNDVRVKYSGKKGELTAVLKGMKDLSAEERPVIGALVNEVRDALENKINTKNTWEAPLINYFHEISYKNQTKNINFTKARFCI